MMPDLAREKLLQIIETQSEIAMLGPNLGNVMQVVAERVRELVGAVSVILELAEGSEMVYRAASGAAEPHLGLRLPITGSLSGLCVGTGEILRCDDTEFDPRVNREACRKVGVRSMVVVPLKHRTTPVGVLKIASDVPEGFDEQDVETLQLMAGLIAASMARAGDQETSDLYHRATHDSLTGLANRSLYYDRFRQSLALARRNGTHLALLNLDLDGLKPINDVLGHRAGDASLREVAIRLEKSIPRKSDTVARVGGDEFAVVLSEVKDRETVRHLSDRLGENIRQPFAFESQPVGLSASIGVAVFPGDGSEIEDLIESADADMYAMKRSRKLLRA